MSTFATWDLDHDALNVVCPSCGFGFDSCHEDDTPGDVTYSCPMCGATGSPSAADLAVIAKRRAGAKK
jgi:predicted RNA-binding Zn-ribbon protein involved in translation (DUF1610 family)